MVVMVPYTSAMSFAKHLQALRREKDLTQQELASRAGISVWSVREYEQGRREPTFGHARRLAAALGVSMNDLSNYPGSDEPEDEPKKPRKK